MTWMIWKLVSLERFWPLTDHCWDSSIQSTKKGWHYHNVRPPRYLSWFITPITMVYGRQITIATGAYKPTYNWGASHCNIYVWLVVYLPLWKMMELKSVGIMKFPIYGKIKKVPNHQPDGDEPGNLRIEERNRVVQPFNRQNVSFHRNTWSFKHPKMVPSGYD